MSDKPMSDEPMSDKAVTNKTTADKTTTDKTLWQLFAEAAEKYPNTAMLIDTTDSSQLTFSEALQQSERLAAALFNRGVRAGTIVTWLLPTRTATVLLTLALARIGAVQNPVLHLYRERELSGIVAQSKPKIVVVPTARSACDYPQMAKVAIANSGHPAELMVLGESVLDESLPQADPVVLPPSPQDSGVVRWIYCTSGTTSTPKGVLHTDSSLIGGGDALCYGSQPTERDVGSLAFPFAHIGGVIYIVMQFRCGFPIVLIDKFIPDRVIDIFRRYGVTMGGGSTAHYQAILAEQRKQPGAPIVPSLRILSGGGAAKPPELYFDVVREVGCAVVHAYGMTESPLAVSNSVIDTDEDCAYTDGKPVSGMQVRIVRNDGSLADAGEEGEIRIRGTNVCKGYLDPEQTDAAFDESGFFRTGDLGVLSATGRLSITGRIKDVIIRKGENISAKEIEDLLYMHPKIGDVAVIGLPDADRGERVCAVVELKDTAKPITFAEMSEFLQSHQLMKQKIPEQLEIIDRLPRNEALNKVIKYQLRDRYKNSPIQRQM